MFFCSNFNWLSWDESNKVEVSLSDKETSSLRCDWWQKNFAFAVQWLWFPKELIHPTASGCFIQQTGKCAFRSQQRMPWSLSGNTCAESEKFQFWRSIKFLFQFEYIGKRTNNPDITVKWPTHLFQYIYKISHTVTQVSGKEAPKRANVEYEEKGIKKKWQTPSKGCGSECIVYSLSFIFLHFSFFFIH